MTRRDYELLAFVIREFTFTPDNLNVDELIREGFAHRMAAALREDNPRFDPGRFVQACRREA